MKHLLVTNDFPPKVGGIQSYLWELWRRLPANETTVLTASHSGSEEWDAAQDFRVIRRPEPVLIPHPLLYRDIKHYVAQHEVDAVIVDPVLPLGPIGFGTAPLVGVVAHGAEITIPGRLPLSRQVMGAVLRRSDFVIAAGRYPLSECERAAGKQLNGHIVPPGVDTERFVPLSEDARMETRRRLGIPKGVELITSVSRLVPRKGMDVLIEAVTLLAKTRPNVHLAIAGSGREAPRLQRQAAALGAPVSFMGRLSDADLADFYGCGDVFSMLCQDRWFGLEQEGFGIVFLEAAACAVPQVAGRSGGSHEAVEHGVSGLVVDEPSDPIAAAAALDTLLNDPVMAKTMGAAGRDRAISEFSYDHLGRSLHRFLEAQRVVRGR